VNAIPIDDGEFLLTVNVGDAVSLIGKPGRARLLDTAPSPAGASAQETGKSPPLRGYNQAAIVRPWWAAAMLCWREGHRRMVDSGSAMPLFRKP
jgi:hypothetical protein